MTNPLLLTASSKLTNPSNLSPTTYEKWYTTIHLPDVLAVPGVSVATMLKGVDSEVERSYLVVYEVDKAEALASQAMKDVPVTCPGMFEGPIAEHADFEIGVWEVDMKGVGGVSGLSEVRPGESVVMVRYGDGDDVELQKILVGLKENGGRSWRQGRVRDSGKVLEMYVVEGSGELQSLGFGNVDVKVYTVIDSQESK